MAAPPDQPGVAGRVGPTPVPGDQRDHQHHQNGLQQARIFSETVGVTGVAPERRSPEYLAKFVADEHAFWGKKLKALKIEME